jgi:hypothetical protein
MAKAPKAITGVSFNSSRLLTLLNLRLSVREFIHALLASNQIRFAIQQKVTERPLDAA